MPFREYRLPGSGAVELSLRDHEGGRPPLLALHGLASNARWWDLVADRLTPEHRLVAVDQRGHGLSDKPASGYDFEACLADAGAVAARLELAPYVAVGHSWGASVALTLAAEHPDDVMGLVLIDGGVTDLRGIFGDNWADAESAMAPPDLRGLDEAQIRRWAEVSPLADATEASAAAEILLGNFEPDEGGGLRPRLTRSRHMEIARHLFEFDNLRVLARVRCPVLLLMASAPGAEASHPARIQALKESGVADAMARLGERGAAVWIEGEHDLPVQRPDEVATAIRAFIDSLEPNR